MKDLATYIAEARRLSDLKGKRVGKIEVDDPDNTVYILFGINHYAERILAFAGKPVPIMFDDPNCHIKDDMAYTTFYGLDMDYFERSIERKSLTLISGFPSKYKFYRYEPVNEYVKMRLTNALTKAYPKYNYVVVDDPKEWSKIH